MSLDNSSTAILESEPLFTVIEHNPNNPGEYEEIHQFSPVSLFRYGEGPTSITALFQGRLQSTGADFAESLLLENASMSVARGTVVGVKNARISLNTDQADRVMVVSNQHCVLGTYSTSELESPNSPVSFMGQVDTTVRGPVRSGDIILASGLNDGVAIALPISSITPDLIKRAIGQAWETNLAEPEKLVRVAIVPINFEGELFKKYDLEISRLRDALNALNEKMSVLLESK